ncbi:MAG: caspase family protein, partial [Pseudomonadota bacterium]
KTMLLKTILLKVLWLKERKSINSIIITFAFFAMTLISVSSLHARPFGMQSMSNIRSTIRNQVRQAFIPVLKSKYEKIEFPKIMAFSKNYQSFAFLTEGGYVSIWNLKQGKEYFNLQLANITPAEIIINNANNELFIIDINGSIYRKPIFSQEAISKYQPIAGINKFKHLKTVKNTQILSAGKQLIIAPNIPLKKSFVTQLDNEIVALDISSDAKTIVVASANKISLFQLSAVKTLKKIKQWELSQTIKQVVLDDFTGSIAIRFESSIFSNAGYAILNKIKTDNVADYKDIQLFNDTISDLVFTQQGQLGVYTSNKEIYYRNLFTGKIDKRLSIAEFNPELVQFYRSDEFIFIPVRDKGIHLIDIKSAKKLAQLVSTKNGWAVLDSSGRYDGNEIAVADISWEVNGKMLELDRFSKRYFEPGLLAKVVFNSTKAKSSLVKKIIVSTKMLTKPENKLEEGVFLPPQVSLKINSDESQYQSSKKISLTITALTEDDAKNLKGLKLYHNGKRLKNNDIVVSNKVEKNSKKWQLEIKALAGKNTFMAEVGGWGDIYGQSKTESFYAKAKKKKSVVFIKSIGIDEYNGKELDLNFAVADAKDIFQVISNYQSSLQKKSANIKSELSSVKTLLLNEKASKKKILAMLDKVKKTATAEDTLFIFMSGHGQVVENKWYFLPQETKTLLEPGHVKKVGLSASELSDKLVTIPNQKIVLIIDACQSGAATEDFNNFQQRRDLSGLSKDTGIHIMAATRADQLAPEYSQLGHGIFTYIMLSGLKKNKKGFYNADRWPKDGKVMISELKKYTEKFVPIMISVLEKRRENQIAARGIANQRTIVTPVGSSIGKDFQLF